MLWIHCMVYALILSIHHKASVKHQTSLFMFSNILIFHFVWTQTSLLWLSNISSLSNMLVFLWNALLHHVTFKECPRFLTFSKNIFNLLKCPSFPTKKSVLAFQNDLIFQKCSDFHNLSLFTIWKWPTFLFKSRFLSKHMLTFPNQLHFFFLFFENLPIF